jgi:hypothetical protein
MGRVHLVLQKILFRTLDHISTIPTVIFVLGFGGNDITFSVMGMSIISDALSGQHNKFLE